MGKNSLLFDSLFQPGITLDDVTGYLSKVTEDYPYFSPAQFYLLLHTPVDSSAFSKQLSKTCLLFNNAHWLNFQLLEDSSIIDSEPIENNEPETSIEPYLNETASVDSHVIPASIPYLASVETATEDLVATAGIEDESQSDLPLELDDEYLRPNDGIKEAEVSTKETTEVSSDETFEEDILLEENAETVVEANEAAPSISIENETVDEAAPTVLTENETVFVSESGSNGIDNPPEIITSSQEFIPENNEYRDADFLPGEGEVNDTEPLEATTSLIKEDIERPLTFKLNPDQENTAGETIAFEPLHTSDYFASLGIKLSHDLKPNDKLGKQLKSFTEWLKTMKKIHPVNDNEEDPADKVIQKMAEKSNASNEVVTEAMAEVLIQQGKIAKAVQVYEKLSLTDPSKNAYFAAKIDQLK